MNKQDLNQPKLILDNIKAKSVKSELKTNEPLECSIKKPNHNNKDQKDLPFKNVKEDGFNACNTFNVYVSGLYWKKMPKGICLDNEEKKEVSRKQVKVLIGSNIAGDFKLKPLVYSAPRPTNDGKVLMFKSNTLSLYKNWFKNYFIPEAQLYCMSKQMPFKVLVLIHNAIDPKSIRLINPNPCVKIVLFPKLKPAHQEITKMFKAYYTLECFRRLRQYKQDLKAGWQKYSDADASRLIALAWHKVSQGTLIAPAKNKYPFLFTSADTIKYDDINAVIRRIVAIGRKLQVKTSIADVLQLIDSHDKDPKIASARPKDLMNVAKLTEGLQLIQKGLQVLESVDCNTERVAKTKAGIQDHLKCYQDIVDEKQKASTSTK